MNKNVPSIKKDYFSDSIMSMDLITEILFIDCLK